jgi:two-component system response regulator AtoC
VLGSAHYEELSAEVGVGESVLKKVLIVDDEENQRLVLRAKLRRAGFEVETAASGKEALETYGKFSPDLVLSDLKMPEVSGLDLIRALKARGNGTLVILMSAYADQDEVVQAVREGAFDYVSKPLHFEDLLHRIGLAEESVRLRRENELLKRGGPKGLRGIVARSVVMEDLFKTVRKVAEYKSTVLLLGESGTGKELFARAIHEESPRRGGPFVAVNCGAIPESLLESELFGHKRGAFTDATADKRGLFEEASGGTLFLDEVGELPLGLQVKLLRALQEGKIRRLGDTKDAEVDVRIVAATARDLVADVKTGRFREDLFYRLNVLPLAIPPLRARADDVPLLVEHFVAKNNARLGTKITGISPEALAILCEYGWPGNVRELENTIERAMVLAETEALGAQDLPERVRDANDPVKLQLASGEMSIKRTMRVIEEVLIRRALEKTGGNRTSAAKLLEISHRALLYKIKGYGI